jgi:hypothetical protein
MQKALRHARLEDEAGMLSPNESKHDNFKKIAAVPGFLMVSEL